VKSNQVFQLRTRQPSFPVLAEYITGADEGAAAVSDSRGQPQYGNLGRYFKTSSSTKWANRSIGPKYNFPSVHSGFNKRKAISPIETE